MKTHILKKWFLLSCIFLMCPRRARLTSVKALHQRSVNQNPNQMNMPVMALEESEPGFDITEEEAKRLKLWPAGIIPYFIDDYSFDKVLRDRVRKYLDSVNSLTGVQFLELPSPPGDVSSRWVFFLNRRSILACPDVNTKNFTSSGVQKVVLGYDCMRTDEELSGIVLAILGVPPQHNAPNRDAYVEVDPENIIPEKLGLFEKIKDDEWLFHEVDYDYNSAGHFDFHKHTINGKATLKPLRPILKNSAYQIDDKGFSFTDVWKIRMLYNYNSKSKTSAGAPHCSKLYGPGKNFTKFRPLKGGEVPPRRKPNRYLGLPDDVPDQEQESDEANKKPQVQGNKAPSKMNENDEDSKGARQEDSKNKGLSDEIKSLKGKTEYRDILSVVSDYQSQEK